MPDGLIHAAGKTFDTTGKEIFENEQTELQMKDSYDTEVEDIQDQNKFLSHMPKMMPDGFYHLANGKVIDKRGNAIDTSDINDVQMKDSYDTEVEDIQDQSKLLSHMPKMMPDGFYHLANGKVIDKQGNSVDISDISELQMKDAYDTNLDNKNDDAEYFRSKAKAPKIMPDGYYHLSNGKVLDTAGNTVDSSAFDISNVAINDWYDDDFEKMVKKESIHNALPAVHADGLMHVMQKGVDRAFDPKDFHEVKDDTEI